MKQIALEACRELAGWIYDGGCSFAWTLADRIERRFRVQGATDAFLSQLQSARAEFLKEQSARHDALHPDRLTYLHR